MEMASNGHFLTQIPQPMHSVSESLTICARSANVHHDAVPALLAPSTSMQSLPMRTTGHDFLHSCRQFFGLHLSSFTIAMRVSSSALHGMVRGQRSQSKCLGKERGVQRQSRI